MYVCTHTPPAHCLALRFTRCTCVASVPAMCWCVECKLHLFAIDDSTHVYKYRLLCMYASKRANRNVYALVFTLTALSTDSVYSVSSNMTVWIECMKCQCPMASLQYAWIWTNFWRLFRTNHVQMKCSELIYSNVKILIEFVSSFDLSKHWMQQCITFDTHRFYGVLCFISMSRVHYLVFTHRHAHNHTRSSEHANSFSLYRILPSWFEHNIIRNGDYNCEWNVVFNGAHAFIVVLVMCVLWVDFSVVNRMQLYIFRHSLIILHKHGVVFCRCPSLLNDISMHERFLYGQRVAIEDTENGREIIQPKTKYTHIRSGTTAAAERRGERGSSRE